MEKSNIPTRIFIIATTVENIFILYQTQNDNKTKPSDNREVPQLIEGSKSCQLEVKASKSDKRLRSYSHLKMIM